MGPHSLTEVERHFLKCGVSAPFHCLNLSGVVTTLVSYGYLVPVEGVADTYAITEKGVARLKLHR